jgi:hypothetical protein
MTKGREYWVNSTTAKLPPEAKNMWAVFFSSVASLRHHPGYSREGSKRPTMAECGVEADAMLDEWLARFK